MFIAVLLLSAITTPNNVIAVHKIEVNISYNRQTGEKRFEQIIFWKDWKHISCYILINEQNKKGIVTFSNHMQEYPYGVMIIHKGRRLIVKSKKYVSSHTYRDPEEHNRHFLKIDDREDFLK